MLRDEITGLECTAQTFYIPPPPTQHAFLGANKFKTEMSKTNHVP